MGWEHGTEGLYLLEMAEKGRRTKLKSKTKWYKILSSRVNQVEPRSSQNRCLTRRPQHHLPATLGERWALEWGLRAWNPLVWIKMVREQPARKENSKCQMLRRIDPALLPGELVPRRGQSAPGRRNKEALPENPEVMSTMAPSASERHCQGCGKNVATPPDLRMPPLHC